MLVKKGKNQKTDQKKNIPAEVLPRSPLVPSKKPGKPEKVKIKRGGKY